MKTVAKYLRLGVMITLVAAITFHACHEEDFPPAIQFTLSNQSVDEGKTVVIEFRLDKPASQAGHIKVSMEGNAIYDQDYTTDPPATNQLNLTVFKGQKAVAFKVNVIDNDTFDHGKFILFSLESVSEGLQMGAVKSITLLIKDDEGPSLVNFKASVSSVMEKNKEGIIVQIPFTAPAKGNGRVIVSFAAINARLGREFKINTATSLMNTFVLPVFPSDSSVSFTLIPIHNEIVLQNQQIVFTISGTDGVVKRGTHLTHIVTIMEEDDQALINFANEENIISEKDNGILVEVPFSTQSPGVGEIIISLSPFNTAYGVGFTTEPPAVMNMIKLTVADKQPKAYFVVYPQDDAHCNPDRYINFEISVATGSLSKGTALYYNLNLTDNEVVNHVNFTNIAGSVDEQNSNGIPVELELDFPASEDAVIYIYSSAGCNYYGGGDYFKTQPPVICDYFGPAQLQLNVLKGDQHIEFIVLPINHAITSNYHSHFQYEKSTDTCLQAGANARYDLTILNKD